MGFCTKLGLLKRLYFVCICLTIFHSCTYEEQNSYFKEIQKEISTIKSDKEKISILYNRELKKYINEGDEKYLFSSKYVELFLYADERKKQMPIIYDLLELNKGKYDYITIACNYHLSNQFETNSPYWAMKYIDKAIEVDKTTAKNYFLPHLYNFKGKLFYNENDYPQAIVFFKKALETYGNQPLYTASVHHNLAMTYDQINALDKAINEVEKGIGILNREDSISDEQKIFLNLMKGSLAQYLIKKGDNENAEKLLVTKWKFEVANRNYEMALQSSKVLFNLYHNLKNEHSKEKAIVDSLVLIEPYLQNISDRIILNEIRHAYYTEVNDLPKLQQNSKILINLNKENSVLLQEKLNDTINQFDDFIIKNYEGEIQAKKRTTIVLYTLIILLFFLFLILIMRKIRKNREKVLHKDLELSQEKLKDLHYNIYLKNEKEKELLQSISKLKKSKNISPQEILQDLQMKMQNLIEIDKQSSNFLDQSSLQHKIFIEKLSEKFPNLNENELKLCLYFKMQLSAKEISLLEKLTVGSIRVYKSKIKFKMGLEKEESLSGFLNDLK